MSGQAPPTKHVRLTYAGDGLAFLGRWSSSPHPPVVFDSDGARGPSPMDGLLMSLAACMAVDVKLILDKSRVAVDGLEVEARGVRAPTDPRRFTSVELTYRVEGTGDEHRDKLRRALRLSRDTYCSVLHTLDPALELGIRVEDDAGSFALEV